MGDQHLDALLGEFLAEAEDRMARVEQILLDLPNGGAEKPELLKRARRELHTLKGNAGMMGFEALQAATHRLEDLTENLDPERPDVQPLLTGLDRLRLETAALDRRHDLDGETKRAGEGVRLGYDRLDSLVEDLGAQLIARHRMSEALAAVAATGDDTPGSETAEAIERCGKAWLELERLLESLQAELLDLRMVPVNTLFGRLRRLVHDESVRSGKEARLETRGGNTSVDRALIDAAGEVMGHLARNAIVHGIETPEERIAAGKERRGLVRIEAAVRSDSVHIDVLDDGAGIDREALLRAAEEAEIEVPEDDLQALMFYSGLTTRRATDLSAGRGVGMDVVLAGVHRTGGSIEVASRSGVGTRFRLRLPTSVSITKAVLLEADGRAYALPVSAVLDTVALPHGESSATLDWRDRELPLVDLGQILGSRPDRRRRGLVLVVDAGGRHFGLAVDASRGPFEIMVRGLDDLLQGLPGVSGSSVLGDGRVVLILDPQELVTLSLVGEAA
jgi:two-component system chemotaxis sensor kinase CheA